MANLKARHLVELFEIASRVIRELLPEELLSAAKVIDRSGPRTFRVHVDIMFGDSPNRIFTAFSSGNALEVGTGRRISPLLLESGVLRSTEVEEYMREALLLRIPKLLDSYRLNKPFFEEQIFAQRAPDGQHLNVHLTGLTQGEFDRLVWALPTVFQRPMHAPLPVQRATVWDHILDEDDHDPGVG